MIDDRSSSEQMPETIGRYQVKECIGFGAMGAVYKAFDPLIKRTLAIKTIRLDIPRQSPQYKSFIERFYHEARISGTLSHPNIVTLFDIGEENGIPYLAMEFVEGQTLSSLTDKGVRFKPELVIGLVSQVASAVDYAHRMGVIHRDIKPSNLILFDEERVKVTDFGIAKLVDTEMTQSGQLLGTPSYMSPEQAMGEKVDGRSDIFSLGVCAFEMLSGEQPFPGNNVTAILYKLAHVEPVEPANLEMNGLVPQKWHEVFGKVLAKRPDDRYQTAADFVRDLEYCLGSWFGAAMGDETMGQDSPLLASERLPSDSTRTIAPVAAPAGPDVDFATVDMAPKPTNDNATQPMKRGELKAPPATSADRTVLLPATPAAAPPPAPAAPRVSEPLPTVMMMTPVPGTLPPAAASPDSAGQTIVMEASALTPTLRVPGSTKAPAPPPAPATPEPRKPASTSPATVLMSSAPPATVLMPSAPAAPGPAPATMVLPGTQKMPESEVRAAIATPPAETRPTPRGTAVPRPPAAPVPPPLPPAEFAAEEGPGPRAAEPGKGAPMGLIVGVVALLFLGAVAVGGLWYLKGRFGGTAPTPTPVATPSVEASATPDAPPSPTPPAVVLGALLVESVPSGASVSVNGEARGVTPLSLPDLALGDYELKVEAKGYQPFTQKVTLADAQPVPVQATLSRNAPSLATLDLLSTPFGAAVSIDGTHVGTTPLSGYKLKPGTHRIDLTRQGFEPWSETVKLAAGQSQRVDATLRALPPPTTQAPQREVHDPNRVYQVHEVDAAPKKVSGTSVAYPSSAPRLKSGDSVSVRVSYVVTESGEVSDVKVLESGGKILDEAVAAAVRNWKYTPGQKRGTSVKVQLQLKQTFQAG